MQVLGEIDYRGDIGMEILPWPAARKGAQLGRDYVHRLFTQVVEPGNDKELWRLGMNTDQGTVDTNELSTWPVRCGRM